MKKGKLFVIEGACDGIGKSTQFTLLKNNLENDGKKVVSHHFPSYGTPHGHMVEKYLHGDFGTPESLSQYYITSLYAIDRSTTWKQELEPEYNKGSIVLLDRYTTSSLIYQSALISDLQKKKDFIKYVIDYEYNKLETHQPDEVIFLNAPFDLVTELRNARKQNEGLENDIHESNIDFMKKVYESALFVAEYLNWKNIQCNKENEMRSIEDIQEEIYTLTKKY